MKERKPLVSYVLTAYNIEQFIEEAVKCAFAQTYSPLEIVLSDDCSSDHTFEIMKNMAAAYAGPHTVKLNRNEKNLGITAHMNKAYLELASGEIIIAAHGDDVSSPDRTQISCNFLAEHKNITAVSLSMKSMDQSGRLNGTDDCCVKEVRDYDFFENPGNVPAPSRAFYKKVMTTFGPLNDDCPTEDEIITYRALMLGRNAFLPQIGVYYRKHAASSSNPENFAKFPLEKIMKQQIDDMTRSVDLKLISQQFMDERIKALRIGVARRNLFRKYYADRSFGNLWQLLTSDMYSLRSKLYYIRIHIRHKWEELL